MLYDIILSDAQGNTDYIIGEDTNIIEIAQYKECLAINLSKFIAGEKIECEMHFPGTALIGKQIIIKAKNE